MKLTPEQRLEVYKNTLYTLKKKTTIIEHGNGLCCLLCDEIYLLGYDKVITDDLYPSNTYKFLPEIKKLKPNRKTYWWPISDGKEPRITALETAIKEVEKLISK